MRTGHKILFGCLAAPFLLVFLLAFLVIVFRASPIPEGESVSVSQTDPIGGITPEMLAAEGFTLDPSRPAARPVPVRLNLEEGAFTIRQAPPGTPLHVEGDYDSALYDLTTTLERDDEGHPSYSITFLPKYTLLRRILTDGIVEIDDTENHLTVYIPRDLPIELDVRIAKAESRLFLGGLALTSARFQMKMGSHRILVEEPNPIEMESLVLDSSMGEVRTEGLGLLRSATITVSGGMGEVNVDLGREISRDTTIQARMRMGEMTLGLPRRARVDAATSVWIGESSGNPKDSRYDDDPDLPTITVRGGVTLGELRLQRY